MGIFSDAIWVIIFICGFVVFLGVCAFTACMYQIQQTKKEKRGKK
jgi:flagellar basal body-associated protein FliL